MTCMFCGRQATHEIRIQHRESLCCERCWQKLQHILEDEEDDLLKEQEAVKPILEQDSMVCGVCGHEVIWQKMLGDGIWADEELDYCPHCGRQVKWE